MTLQFPLLLRSLTSSALAYHIPKLFWKVLLQENEISDIIPDILTRYKLVVDSYDIMAHIIFTRISVIRVDLQCQKKEEEIVVTLSAVICSVWRFVKTCMYLLTDLNYVYFVDPLFLLSYYNSIYYCYLIIILFIIVVVVVIIN